MHSAEIQSVFDEVYRCFQVGLRTRNFDSEANLRMWPVEDKFSRSDKCTCHSVLAVFPCHWLCGEILQMYLGKFHPGTGHEGPGAE
jgi:hypothetical protein